MSFDWDDIVASAVAGFLAIALFFVVVLLGGYAVYLLWDLTTLATKTGWSFTYWQSVGIFMLCGMLFKGKY